MSEYLNASMKELPEVGARSFFSWQLVPETTCLLNWFFSQFCFLSLFALSCEAFRAKISNVAYLLGTKKSKKSSKLHNSNPLPPDDELPNLPQFFNCRVIVELIIEKLGHVFIAPLLLKIPTGLGARLADFRSYLASRLSWNRSSGVQGGPWRAGQWF